MSLDACYKSIVACNGSNLPVNALSRRYVFQAHRRGGETVQNDAAAETPASQDFVAGIELAAIHARAKDLP